VSTADEPAFFAFVELAAERTNSVLGPRAAGAFTHVAARAHSVDTFLEAVAAAAVKLGLRLVDVDWVASAHDLSAAQARSPYYHELVAQLDEQTVGWTEFQCYPVDDGDEEDRSG
jgi:hypothetical protein